MNPDRKKMIASIRYDLKLEEDQSGHSAMISFQNLTIRPILKFQNDLIQAQFRAYALQRKVNMAQLNPDALVNFVRKSLTSDQLLKSFYIGLICALFDNEEFGFYLENKREINKRIISMLIQRIISHE